MHDKYSYVIELTSLFESIQMADNSISKNLLFEQLKQVSDNVCDINVYINNFITYKNHLL